jgi:AraC-like DNA-binding protein
MAQVAERVGYASEPAFAKAFRRVIGTPPGAYARRHTASRRG